MGIITRCRVHTAVYWQSKGSDGKGGNVYANPVEVKCRWDDDEELVVQVGTYRHICGTTVFCDRVVHEGDMMWLGTLASVPTPLTNHPQELREAKTVRRVIRIAKLRNSDLSDVNRTLIVAYLS
jgi:hypothetical protein